VGAADVKHPQSYFDCSCQYMVSAPGVRVNGGNGTEMGTGTPVVQPS